MSSPPLVLELIAGQPVEETSTERTEDCTRQLTEAMCAPPCEGKVLAPVYDAEVGGSNSRSDSLGTSSQYPATSSAQVETLCCNGLGKSFPYITPPIIDPDNTHELDGDVLSNDPFHTHQESKKFKLSFFSRGKQWMPKPNKPCLKHTHGLRMSAFGISSMLKPFAKRQDPTSSNLSNNIRDSNSSKRGQPQSKHSTQIECFFDQEVEQRQQFVHFANLSTATLRLQSIEDMETINAALPSLRL